MGYERWSRWKHWVPVLALCILVAGLAACASTSTSSWDDYDNLYRDASELAGRDFTPPRNQSSMLALEQRLSRLRAGERCGRSGRVVVQMIVMEDGSVEAPRIVRGMGGACDSLVLGLVRRFFYDPATVDGEPVKFVTSFTMTY